MYVTAITQRCRSRHVHDHERADSKNPAGPTVRVDLDTMLSAIKAGHLGA